MIKKYEDYIKRLTEYDIDIKRLKKIEKKKEKLEKVYKNEFLSEVIIELSKYYRRMTSDEIRKETGVYISNSIVTNHTSYIDAHFLIDNNFCFVVLIDTWSEYDNLLVNIHRGYSKGDSFVLYKEPYFSINPNVGISEQVQEFISKFNTAISVAQKKRRFGDTVKKYNF